MPQHPKIGEIRLLLEQGTSYEEISRATGISVSYLCKIRKALGIASRQATRGLYA